MQRVLNKIQQKGELAMKTLFYKKEIVDYLKDKTVEIIDKELRDKNSTNLEKVARIDGMFQLIHSVEADVLAEEEAEKAAEEAKNAAVETAYDPEL